jgi:hypothetical protein
MIVGKDLVAASATPLILGILSQGESYGYAIIKRVAELSGGELQWTDGMLYPVLRADHSPISSNRRCWLPCQPSRASLKICSSVA